MKIVVIDGQGGGVGKGIIEQLRQKKIKGEIVAVGTNVMATSSMLHAGADAGATGENAVIYNCSNAQIIVGPIGILMANSMYGEVSPGMVAAVAGSKADIVAIPMSKCAIQVVGVMDRPLAKYLEEAADRVAELAKKQEGERE